jgi:acyl carrier protein
MNDTRTQVRTYIVENLLFGDDTELEDDTSFLESGMIDSTGILEVVSFLEETFSIKVLDDELVPENLDSISNLAGFLRRKFAAAQGEPSAGQVSPVE